ncbi:LacI family transcriptional regulator [Hydrogenoanaerobacterium saccharovorans]|uniref:Transcriptional regulator, LacI family n=1 Tax=Hydrogenoanaerobacterium saccharovorans TaxID=474960 RepID=A0A1H8CPI1_9FIRM|nr:substrate-binding domain-containing protein [Hydrogenoanaerobacterium saccharovorans]RPF43243.1 LacI family transcriptional regulator [Hydrogenoanaerobacterium saccharovorans]SEM96910.1 transcriptional regulator, LacI family [Hydrogenoanaerobacterium saccharovorans]
MAVTIKDIANKAGVSRGTVDRVLNNRGRVKPDVQKRIEEIIQTMGYKPNRAGKALAARKKPITIGCLVPSIDNPYFDKVLNGFRRASQDFADYGISVIVEQVKGYDVQTHIDALDRLLQKKVNALCVVTVDDCAVRVKIDEIVRSGIPVVASNSDLTGCNRLCYVGCNYVQSGQTAAGILKLITGGNTKTLIVTGSVKMSGHNQRIHGFDKCVKMQTPEIDIVDIVECLDDDQIACEQTQHALQSHPEIDSIYITAAGVAGVCRAVKEAGLANKVKIVCFDDPPSTRALVQEEIIQATICQQPYEQGYKPIKILMDYLINGITPKNDKYFTNNIIKIKENI